MSEYSKDVTHRTKRSAQAVAKKMRSSGVHTRVAKVVRYKVVRVK